MYIPMHFLKAVLLTRDVSVLSPPSGQMVLPNMQRAAQTSMNGDRSVVSNCFRSSRETRGNRMHLLVLICRNSHSSRRDMDIGGGAGRDACAHVLIVLI